MDLAPAALAELISIRKDGESGAPVDADGWRWSDPIKRCGTCHLRTREGWRQP